MNVDQSPTPNADFDVIVEMAAARWERIIQDDLPDLSNQMDVFADNRGINFFPGSAPVNADIDDILIGYAFETMDNVSGVTRGGPTHGGRGGWQSRSHHYRGSDHCAVFLWCGGFPRGGQEMSPSEWQR